MAKKRCLAIIGLETITRQDGSIIWSDTFLNNALTWRSDNKLEFETRIVDVRMYRYDKDPMMSLETAIEALQKDAPWDTIFYSGHSDTENLYVFSKIGSIRPELSENARFIKKHTDLSWLSVKPHHAYKTKFYLFGCQTAGKYGRRIDDCIAQCIADNSNCLVYGYACKTAQAKVNGRFFQKPDTGGLFEFKPTKE
jgi:hypothetical protein